MDNINNKYLVIMIMYVINLICRIFELIQIERMRYRSTNDINKEVPITCKIRMNLPLYMLIIIYIN